jgi:Putative amidoligase enzyme
MLRVGLELELLAPDGKSRDDLARLLAKTVGGALRFGLKYHGVGTLDDGRPDCHLTPAARVDVRGKWLASFVDDPTIVDDLSRSNSRRRIARTDDLRLALWMERQCWSADPHQRFEALTRSFATREEDDGLVDPWGHPLLRWHHESTQRARVCEVVLRPLEPKERKPVLTKVLTLARKLGFTVPKEAAVHAHFDAAPFRSTLALKDLVLTWARERSLWLERFEPNPHCRKRGPFPDDVVRVAAAADDDLPFDTLAAGLLLAGLHRAVDLNLLGVVERHPKQPTVEVRCLPGSLDAEATLARLAHADALLARIATVG